MSQEASPPRPGHGSELLILDSSDRYEPGPFKDLVLMGELVGEAADYFTSPNSDYDSPFKPKFGDQLLRTWDMVHELGGKDHQDFFCEHCVRVALLAAEAATFTGADAGMTLLAGLGHDVGKARIDPEVLLISATNEGWEPELHQPEMDKHSLYTYEMAQQRGIDETIAAAMGMHHANQKRSVCNDILLSPEAARIRDALAAADFIDAMLTRNDSWSKGLPLEQRLAVCVENLMPLLGYYSSDQDDASRQQYARQVITILFKKHQSFVASSG